MPMPPASARTSRKPAPKEKSRSKQQKSTNGDGPTLPFRKYGSLFVCWVGRLRFVMARVGPQLWQCYVWHRETGLGPDKVVGEAVASSRKRAAQWAQDYYTQHG